MASVGVDVAGLQELQARLEHAHRGLADLTDANRELVALVAAAAQPATPRRTGKLAAGNTYRATARGWIASNNTAYARFVHSGTRTMRARPWLLVAGNTTLDRAADQLAQHVQHLLEQE